MFITHKLAVVVVVGLAALTAMSGASRADMNCVQHTLSDLGFYSGKLDGQLSPATARAAAIFAANAGLNLPPLATDDSDDWCKALTDFAATPAAKTVSHLDTISEPPGILPDATQQKLWNAYKTAKECFLHPNYDPGTAMTVPMVGQEQLRQTAWVSPFSKVDGAPGCQTQAGNLRIPPVISTVKLDEAYGQRQDEVDAAATWFRRLATYYRLTRDPVARQQLHQAVLDWASGHGLGKGIHVSWGHKPVDYQMMATIMSILTATGEIADSFTADERAVVGPWLNGLVKQSAASFWKDREDDKAYMRDYMALLWGLIVGDDRPVQNAILEYKLAIHDMRPDGSWPIDTQRGGMGIDYDTASTSHIVMIAVALQQARGIDLFDYSVDGRSVHNAVDWIVSAIKDPGKTNRIYAIPCPDGGDRWGSIDAPSTADLDDAGFLLAYAVRFPDRDSSKFIVDHYRPYGTIDSEKQGGAAACQFALTGGTVNLPPLELPKPPPQLPKPQFVVKTIEVIAHQTGDSTDFNSFLRSTIKGGKKGADSLQFNITGSIVGEKLLSLGMVLNDPIGKAASAALAKCPGVQTTTYDDNQPRLVIAFSRTADAERWDPEADIACIAKAAPPLLAFETRFLTTSFRDIAIGLVGSGDVDAFQHNGLKTLLHQVAFGDVQIGGAAP